MCYLHVYYPSFIRIGHGGRGKNDIYDATYVTIYLDNRQEGDGDGFRMCHLILSNELGFVKIERTIRRL